MTTNQEESEAIRQDYLYSLKELTFNSRPIITNLTVIAQESVSHAQAITKAIEEHINKVSSRRTKTQNRLTMNVVSTGI